MSRRLSAREKVLVWLVAGTVLLLLNLFVLQYFFSTWGTLQRDLAGKKTLLAATKQVLADTPRWQEREDWLNTKQPKIENEATAGVQLLNQVEELARKFSVTTEQPAIANPEHQARYTSVAVTMDTKSSWQALHEFLQALQGPEQFIVLEKARLNIDPADQTQMRGNFRIVKWFAAK